MNFRIQASSPRYNEEFDNEVDTLSDAIESVFPLWSESAILMWNTIPIPLSYKYDLSLMIDDILNVLEKLRIETSGELVIHWVSNTFANIWTLTWDLEKLKINSEWGSVVGGTEQLLILSGPVTIPKQSFCAEWKRVLHNIIQALVKSGYKEGILPGMNRLTTEYKAIEKEGIIYNL
ncbi:hypothetical protein [Cohnella abietis]|uniref:Uncharacterized protein n=1 Tax=Cohnella abietis TaxID=2507935 RepID=A0A3T1D0D9_9BACL|nr:hypothetical protein [Cohnella abietis]BBI31544.1 hypothetical protein KCTCHS21_09430 [Cohnella abietis]